MLITIDKPSIPILWLDTGFIWKQSNNPNFWKKLSTLILKNKVIVVDTGQRAEMIDRFNQNSLLVPRDEHVRVLKYYETVVDRYLAIDHSSFQSVETEIAMKGFFEKSSEVKYDFNDLFNPILTEISEMADFLNPALIDKWGTASTFKTLSKSIVSNWKIIREQARRNKENVVTRRNNELLGMHDTIVLVAKSDDIKKKKNILFHYIKIWRKISGKVDIESILKFFKSDYYFKIPYVDVNSWIVSDLIMGNEELKVSDYFDSILISMILPFATYLVIDKSMQNRVEDKLKLTQPNGDYDCKIVKYIDCEKLVDSLM